MAWENKRKIHIARGTESNIIAASASDKGEKFFTDGQPLHIEGNRNYLGVASCTDPWTIAPNLIEPIKVREVKGYLGDINTDHIFTLSIDNKEENMYIFTDEKFNSVNDEPAKGNAYINVGENLGLSFRRKGNEIAGIPQGNDYFLINPKYYLRSENIYTKNILDVNGVNSITINEDNNGIVLNKVLTTSKNVTISGNLTSNTKTILNNSTTINNDLIIDAETTISNVLKNSNESTLIDFSNNEIKTADIAANNISTSSSLTANQAIINTLYAGATSTNINAPLYVTSDQISINQPLTLSNNLIFNGSTFTINSSKDNTKLKGITVGSTSTTAQTTAKVYGTLEVNCINLII